jgi:hypothetical protein
MDKLGELYSTHHFPAQFIFNMDETMLDSSGKKVKVLVRSNSPCPFTENEVKMEHISLGLCVSAAGGFVAPLVIFALKTEPYLLDVVRNFFHISG